MSPFHTKSIERILSPVSKLILLFEDAGVGTEIPDLENRVGVVKNAVDNLIKVGYDTISASDDKFLRRDMPPSLKRVEDASFYLQEAVFLLQKDSGSAAARRKLIEGSRGILQGTSAVLLTFDMSEVRKIIGRCRAVLNVLASSDDVDSLTQLAEFVKRLTPCMADMIKEVDNRQEELTIQSHAALLRRGIEQLKRLTPILISSLKLHINTSQNGLPGAAECRANRNFLVSEMSDEIQEIIRGLQLTESDASELFDDDLAALHVTKATFDSRLQFADEWLRNPCSAVDSAGEKALQQVVNSAQRLADLAGSNEERDTIRNLCGEIQRLAQSMSDCKRRGVGGGPAFHHLGTTCGAKLAELSKLCAELIRRGDRHNPVFRLARTLEGKLVQAQRWLVDPRGPQRQVGLEACRSLIHGARKLMDSKTNPTTNDAANGDAAKLAEDGCKEACEHVERAADRLYTITTQPETPESSAAQHDLSLAISRSLAYIWQTLQQHLVNCVAETYTDLVGPLRQLAETACPSSGCVPNEAEFNEKMKVFLSQCTQLSTTADLAATASLSDVWRADALRCLASQLPELGAQVVLAGRAVVLSALAAGDGSSRLPHTQATVDHFALMRQHWTDSAERMRALVDEAVDANAFIVAQEACMIKDADQTERSIQDAYTTGVVEATTSIARRANRVLQLATREADNSEDPLYVDRMNDAVKQLRSTITPMVSEAKGLVTEIRDPRMHERWRSSNRNLLAAVGLVKQAVGPSDLPNSFYHQHYQQPNSTVKDPSTEIPVKEMRAMALRTSPVLSKTDVSDTDIEEEFDFPPPEENQPIMAAAHALHHEARLWSSRDNELIATTKRMAALMAQLSQIVRGEYGTKKDLINVAMAIAGASLDVNRCAKALAKECTDLRIRSNLLHLSERILTIGNQLRILSTVKATMLESQGSNEDRENTESLVGNAQNLMQSVIEALHVASGASIKIRVDSGYKISWRPRMVMTNATAAH
ncbi:Vinculin [Paragonimus heterotremus]|uniref:Vinculin n=1 Tax=Paragonimus heterotremus TaxID=100268 RepID=A0A8J4SQS1_9TREM|nr:Vinculin [Paragonimus heterotremus]